MGFWKDFKAFRIQQAAARAEPLEKEAHAVPASYWTELENLARWLGISGTKTEALSEATYFACMKVLSEGIGKLPLKLLRHTRDEGIASARDRPMWFTVHDRPNPYMTASTFWSTVEFNRNHYGNAFVWVEGAGRNLHLWILPNNRVQVWYDDARIISEIPDVYYVYSGPDKIYYFGSEEILHFKTSNTLDGLVGVSVREQLAATIESGAKSQEFLNEMYQNGLTAKAVLQYTGSMNDANVKAFVKGIEEYAAGKLKGEGIKNIIPIPLGSTLQPLNLKLTDSQFLELRQYTALQIASAFGIKPYQIGDYTKSSYSSAEAQQLSFYVDTLLFIVKQYEEELTYKLLNRDDIENGYYFKFNIDVILRADFETKVKTLSTAVNSFLMTPNEARERLDLAHKPGGDKLLGNGASIPVEQTGNQYTKGQVTET